jgi:hypothetical protein
MASGKNIASRKAWKRNRLPNALKHGAFAKELLVLDENKKDFDELHESCVAELKPSGQMEEEVVFSVAEYMWRKRRVTRFYVEEVSWLRRHPTLDELEWVLELNAILHRKGMSCNDVWKVLGRLPQDIGEEIKTNFPLPKVDFDNDWVERIKTEVKRWIDIIGAVHESFLINVKFIGETAAKIRELTAKQVALEDRLDMMIDKALKRLANLKMFKEIVIVQETKQPRKIQAP